MLSSADMDWQLAVLVMVLSREMMMMHHTVFFYCHRCWCHCHAPHVYCAHSPTGYCRLCYFCCDDYFASLHDNHHMHIFHNMMLTLLFPPTAATAISLLSMVAGRAGNQTRALQWVFMMAGCTSTCHHNVHWCSRRAAHSEICDTLTRQDTCL